MTISMNKGKIMKQTAAVPQEVPAKEHQAVEFLKEKYIVLFEVIPSEEGKAQYLELAAMLKPMLEGFEGFVSMERFQSLHNENKVLSMNVWDSEEAMSRWRNTMEHRMSQLQGKTKLFESYKITVVSVVREYTHNDRENAPTDSNEYFKS